MPLKSRLPSLRTRPAQFVPSKQKLLVGGQPVDPKPAGNFKKKQRQKISVKWIPNPATEKCLLTKNFHVSVQIFLHYVIFRRCWSCFFWKKWFSKSGIWKIKTSPPKKKQVVNGEHPLDSHCLVYQDKNLDVFVAGRNSPHGSSTDLLSMDLAGFLEGTRVSIEF